MDRIDRRERSAPTSTASAPPPAARTRTASRAASSRPIRNLHRDARDQDQGPHDHRRGHPRGHRRHAVGLRARADVPGADQGEAEQPRDGRRRSTTSSGPALEAWLNANMTAADQIVGRIVLAAKAAAGVARGGQRGQAQVGRVAPAQPARQARRLQVDRPATSPSCSSSRATRAGGSAKQGRNNKHAGRAAAARQDPQLRRARHGQGAGQPGTDRPGHGHRHRRRRQVRPRRPALRQDHPAHGRRRRRPPHHRRCCWRSSSAT